MTKLANLCAYLVSDQAAYINGHASSLMAAAGTPLELILLFDTGAHAPSRIGPFTDVSSGPFWNAYRGGQLVAAQYLRAQRAI
jgi:hypothetical protein